MIAMVCFEDWFAVEGAARARLFVVWSPDRRESKKTRDENDVGRNNESETLSRIISFNFLISKGKDDWKHSL